MLRLFRTDSNVADADEAAGEEIMDQDTIQDQDSMVDDFDIQ